MDTAADRAIDADRVTPAADRTRAGDPDLVDPVLRARRPRFTLAQAPGIAKRTFGLRAHAARDLGSERDQAFLLADDADRPVAVMKISNTTEDPSTLDMEALAVIQVARVDPDLPLAMPWPIPGAATDSPTAGDRRASFHGPDGVHHVRMYDVLPGRQRVDAAGLSDTALLGWGETTARLDRALRGFFHPSAQRTMVWDVQHALQARAFLAAVRDDAQRSLAERALDRFEAVVVPLWPSLRAQVVHGDLTVDNALTDAAGRITGIVDFGDMSHSTILTELASVLDSLVVDRGPDELFRVSRLVLDGYQRITPLEDGELRLVGEALAARAAVTIAISSWRAELGLEDRAFAERYNASVARNIETLLAVGWDETARRFGAERGAQVGRTAPVERGVPVERAERAERGGVDRVAHRAEVGLIERRDAVLGPALEPLTYDVPIHVASARGIWLTDVQGQTYLDAYNNVPCVGHGHPRVTEAIARQGRRLNTNLRYLHDAAVELAERLVDTCPPGLDTVLFVNSGSEANDLAWRLATVFTGQRGGLCTDFAYHGVTEATAALSPESWTGRTRPDHVETWAPAGPYRGVTSGSAAFVAAIERLAARGIAPAAAILDGVLTSDGYLDPAPGEILELLRLTHEAGGLWIADEVQGGHGRTGHWMWSFERYGIVPDVVTLGKPMGNGHPVGAVITRREIVERFADGTVFFSTFGGNQVSVAASMAVLDVLEDERVLERTSVAGAALREAIVAAVAGHPAILEVRGVGLAIGVECRDKATARAIKEGLRTRGVLIGTSDRGGNVLKVRPPLAFTTADVPIFREALDSTLATLAGA